MKNNLIRVVIFIFAAFFVIYSFINDRDHPPELARVTDLRVGYYSHDEKMWIYTTQLPADERRLKVCGIIEKSRSVKLLFTISNPSDINDFLYLGKSFFDVEPGRFCETVYVAGEIVPGKYTLWILDARREAGRFDIEWLEK